MSNNINTSDVLYITSGFQCVSNYSSEKKKDEAPTPTHHLLHLLTKAKWCHSVKKKDHKTLQLQGKSSQLKNESRQNSRFILLEKILPAWSFFPSTLTHNIILIRYLQTKLNLVIFICLLLVDRTCEPTWNWSYGALIILMLILLLIKIIAFF